MFILISRNSNGDFGCTLLVPIFGYAIGVALYSEGDLTFWKVLARSLSFILFDSNMAG